MQHGRLGWMSFLVVALSCSVFPDEVSDSDQPDAAQGGSSLGGLGGGGTFPVSDSGGASGGTIDKDAPSDVLGDVPGDAPKDGPKDGPNDSPLDGDAESGLPCGGADLSNDPDNCGACGRKCSSANATFRRCANGACDPVCDALHFDCNTLKAPAVDDGCEAAIDDDNCGGCNIKCPVGLHCNPFPGAPKGVCTCENGSCGSGGQCVNRQCVCNGTVTCRIGEVCNGGNCECNGAGACASLQTCCPNGCFNVTVSPTHCGGCDFHCIGGMVCKLGRCKCDGDADCDAGSPGKCVSEQCVCGSQTCEFGERCRSDGKCH